MKRKFVSIILATALVGTLLTGCGGSGSDSTTTQPAEEETEAPAETEAAAETPAEEETAPSEDAAAGSTEGKNLPELTTEPLTINLWDIATEGSVRIFRKAL